ncbi:Cys/Met metabolism PLP-dependent enzyme [Popillia japonica]|uniref:cystathionine gamma-lyase n=1 Tax=Popillia japonica TaxID=7064 RepID=A0AAW1KPJ2_POPJA
MYINEYNRNLPQHRITISYAYLKTETLKCWSVEHKPVYTCSPNENMAGNSGYLPIPKGFTTRAIHSSTDPDRWDSLCIVPPIVLSATFKHKKLGDYKYEYGRAGNPSRDVLEGSLSAIEGAKYAVTFASGLGALTAIINCYTQGDHFVIGDDMYGGNYRLFEKVAKNLGVEVTMVDATNIDNVKNALKPNTKLIFIETPTNPLLKVFDIRAIAEIAKNNKALFCVDNTFLTPYFQRPLELGADISSYSLTKYMNGHTDVIMGAIVTNNEEVYTKLRFLQNAMGIVPGPFDCSLVTRSLKTLSLRMERHMSNSLAVAKFLETHPKVLKVIHPGLESHPYHELTKRQTSGHSGMMSMYIDGGRKEAENFLTAIKLFIMAESLGGYESLAEIPSIMTHASLPPELLKELNITDNMIRLSIGLEDPEDLIKDLDQALKAITFPSRKKFHFIKLDWCRSYSANENMSDNSGYLPLPKGFTTKAIHSSADPDRWDSKCIVPPLVLSTTFKHIEPGKYNYVYGRDSNPTRDVLERSLCALEDAKYATTFSSGLGAIDAVVQCYTHGDHFVVCDDMYGGNYRMFDKIAKNLGIEVTIVDATIIDNVKNAMKPNTKLIFVESPTNPLMKVYDIKAIAEIAKSNNALFCVDNSFLTPYFQRPLELGADISMYSLTKYMNGHADVILGALVTNNKEMHDKFRFVQCDMGFVPGPFDCSMVTRGLKTLELRLRRHSSNSLAVAKFLESHPRVLKVLHPGLESHPQYELTKRQTSGHSGMMNMYLNGHSGMMNMYLNGKRKETENFAQALKIFTLAGSLGLCESLIAIPGFMTHTSLPAAVKEASGITDNLIRMSIGLEDPEDLISDLDQALNAM